jgi:hypothetical protein
MLACLNASQEGRGGGPKGCSWFETRRADGQVPERAYGARSRAATRFGE